MAVTVIAKIVPQNNAFVGVVDADQALVSSAGFTGNLSAADTTVQAALATIDGLPVSGAGTTGSLGIRMSNSAGIGTGSKGFRACPFALTITGWRLVANAVGGIVVDVKKCAFAGYPTTVSITGTAKPTLTAAQTASSNTLTGWTIAVNAGDILEFVVNSASGITNATLDIQYTRSA